MAVTRHLLERIKALPDDFHEAGVMTGAVLDEILAYLEREGVQRSAETGSGKTTLLFSQVSDRHTVFTLESYGDIPCESYENVIASELFNSGSTRFVLGPTQETLPRFDFPESFEFVLLDGPHGFPFPCLEYYHFYPHLEVGGILAIDDVHIPSVRILSDFLRTERMFQFEKRVGNTDFYRRTREPTFNPIGDDWWLQKFNESGLQSQPDLVSRLKHHGGKLKNRLRRRQD